MHQKLALTSAASLYRLRAAPADLGMWLRFWESRSPWAVPRFARTVYRWKVLCWMTSFLENVVQMLTHYWPGWRFALTILAIMCNLSCWKQTCKKLSTYPWKTAPAKWPPPVMRMTHTVFLLMHFREDTVSCSSSDWDITGTEKLN